MQIPRVNPLPSGPVEASHEATDQDRKREEKKKNDRPGRAAAASQPAGTNETKAKPNAEQLDPGQCLDTQKWVQLLPESAPSSSDGADKFLREARAKSVTEGTRVLKKA